MDLRELEDEGRKRCWEWGRTRAPGRDGTNRDHGGPANRGVLHEALPFGLVALYTWHFGPSITPPKGFNQRCVPHRELYMQHTWKRSYVMMRIMVRCRGAIHIYKYAWHVEKQPFVLLALKRTMPNIIIMYRQSFMRNKTQLLATRHLFWVDGGFLPRSAE